MAHRAGTKRYAWLILALGPAVAPPAAKADPPGPAATGYSLFDPTPDADLRDMDTDRPNRTDTPHTVDAGHLQIETGLLDFVRQWGANPGNLTALSTSQVNARVGVTGNFELNVALDSFDWQHVHAGGTNSGIGDLTIGGKLNFWGDAGSDDTWATALAMKPQIKLPTAGSTLGDGHVEAYVEFPFLMNLPDGFHLGLQVAPGVARNTANTAYVGGTQASISVDRVLIAQADVYVEYSTQLAVGGITQHTADIGFTYPVGKNLVLDSGVFLGLNRASPSFEYLGGFSVRF